jgi:SAM-dependent methyltransferase
MAQDGTGLMSPDDHTRPNRSTYDTIAPLYARNQARTRAAGPPPFETLRSRFAAGLSEDALMADIGCGPGFDLAEFSQLGMRVVGLDTSAGMLASAHGTFVYRLAQADMRALPLAPSRLDGIWCVAALLHVEQCDTAQVLGEFRRALRPGGVLALVTAAGDSQGWERVAYAPLEQRWFVYRDPERLRREVESGGFLVISEERVELGRPWWTCLARAM